MGSGCCFGHDAYTITTGSYKTEHKSNLDIYVTFSKLLSTMHFTETDMLDYVSYVTKGYIKY